MKNISNSRRLAGLTLLTALAVCQSTQADDVWMVIEQVDGVEQDEEFFDAHLLPGQGIETAGASEIGGHSQAPWYPCLPPDEAFSPCPTPGIPIEPGVPTTPPAEPPTDQPPSVEPTPLTPAPAAQPAPQADFSAALQGGSLLASANVPGMMGDFFGGGTSRVVISEQEFFAPDPAAGGVVVGRQKLSENTSPIPRDRVFLNYSYFDNTPLAPGGVNVNRITPGFEITLFNDNASIEARFPMASTLSSDIQVTGSTFSGTDYSHGEFGNITLFYKHVLWEGRTALISAGVGTALPTADDLTFSTFGTPALVVQNESVHLLPFIGGAYVPNQRLFAQWIVQVDTDLNGQPVQFDGVQGPTQGRLQDRTYLFASGSVGYWMFYNPNATSGLTGLAPMAELHLNQSLTRGDSVSSGIDTIGAPQHFTLFNAVLGGTAQFGQNVTLHGGYAFPIGGGRDAQFDGEFRLMLNWFFGGPRRFRTVPN